MNKGDFTIKHNLYDLFPSNDFTIEGMVNICIPIY